MKRVMIMTLNYKTITVALWGISLSFLGQTNQTLGVFINAAESFNGYTLFAPVSNETTYLIDNCGSEINSWESTYKAGMMAYLLEDGCIMRAGKSDSKNFLGGGIGGVMTAVPECETGYNTAKGVECYESTKGDGALVYQPLSTGITYQLIPKATADDIPLLTTGYGRTYWRQIRTPPLLHWDQSNSQARFEYNSQCEQ